VIIRDSRVVNAMVRIFEADWSSTEASKVEAAKLDVAAPVTKAATKAVEVIAKDLPSVAPVVEQAVQQIVGDQATIELDPKEVQATIKDAVKKAVKGLVRELVDDEEHFVGDASMPLF
jgi:D-aminopeptidase